MNHITKLQQATNRDNLARLLGFSASSMAYILYKKGDLYTSFEIPKKSGGSRHIDAPCPELKLLQTRLLELLDRCIVDLNHQSNHKSPMSHGFKKNYSIATNAQKHKNKRFIFNIDLEDFFPSINFGRVRGFFIKNKHFQLAEPVATTIAQIACHNDGLPQGSPSSPVISNLIGHLLDVHLAKLAKDNGCTYSRYADDITFSTNKRMFPEKIGILKDDWSASSTLKKIVSKHGFSINHKKTRLVSKDARQTVTGLTTNKKVNTPFNYWHDARAMTHNLLNTGSFYITDGKQKKPGCIQELEGMLSFIDSIDVFNKKIRTQNTCKKPIQYQRKLNSREKNYKNFLFYKYFHANEHPRILYEGKTDPIILTCAVKKLSSKYPELVDNRNSFAFQTISHSKNNSRLLCLGGGTGAMRNLIPEINSHLKKFKAPKSKKPVVFLVDNDPAGEQVKSAAKKVKGHKSGNGFVKFGEKFYVVNISTTPSVKEIEDLFSPAVLNTLLGTRSFSRSENYNKSTHYGKIDFAEKVIKEKRKTIDFSRFSGLLNILEEIIKGKI